MTVVLVGLLAWVAYAVFPASFAVGFAFITALVVFLLNAISPDTRGHGERAPGRHVGRRDDRSGRLRALADLGPRHGPRRCWPISSRPIGPTWPEF